MRFFFFYILPKGGIRLRIYLLSPVFPVLVMVGINNLSIKFCVLAFLCMSSNSTSCVDRSAVGAPIATWMMGYLILSLGNAHSPICFCSILGCPDKLVVWASLVKPVLGDEEISGTLLTESHIQKQEDSYGCSDSQCESCCL